jgi:hypothetical protein
MVTPVVAPATLSKLVGRCEVAEGTAAGPVWDHIPSAVPPKKIAQTQVNRACFTGGPADFICQLQLKLHSPSAADAPGRQYAPSVHYCVGGRFYLRWSSVAS